MRIYFSDFDDLSDDVVADPDFEIFNNVLDKSNTKIVTVSDSDTENSTIQVITSDQIHVTSLSQDQNESFSILSGDIETDPLILSSPVNMRSSDSNIMNYSIKTVADLSNKITHEVVKNVFNNKGMIKIHGRTQRKGRTQKERENRKKLRNSGQCYVTEKGKTVPKRQSRSLSTCRMKCRERFSEIERKKCFNEYWTLGSRHRRAMYMASLITILPKKSQITDSRVINRDCYCKYKLVINNEDKPICKECLRRTLGENIGFINNVMKNKKHSAKGIIPVDKRGRRPSKHETNFRLNDYKYSLNMILTPAKDHIL